MGTQMREHLLEEEDTGLALLRQHFSEKEVAPVSTAVWRLLKAFPCWQKPSEAPAPATAFPSSKPV